MASVRNKTRHSKKRSSSSNSRSHTKRKTKLLVILKTKKN